MAATEVYNEPDLTYNSFGTYNDPFLDISFIGGAGIELYVFDKFDTAELVDVIPDRMTPSYLEELRGPGGGSFRISKSDPKLLANPNLLDYRNVVRVYVGGILRGAWIITKKSEVIIGTGELADQAYEVSGPGLRTWLADAVVYPLGALGRLTKTSRTFSFASPRGNWYNLSDWTPIVQMCRQDAGRLLSASIVAQGIPISGAAMATLISVELAAAAAADAAGTTYVMKSGASLPPDTAPDGKTKRASGYILAGSGGVYQLYGSVASPSEWWWDANGFHRILASINDAPPTDPTTGATRYPTLQGPGYAVYVMVDPTTGVWDTSTSAANIERARKTIYIRAEGFILTDTFQDEDGHTGEALSTSVAEIAPPGNTEVNPWKYGPKDWPTGFAPHARWIWSQESRNGVSGGAVAPMGDVYFRREFTLATAGRYALFLSADNAFVAYLDGEVISESQDVSSSSQTQKVDIDLAAGDHILAVKATNWEAGSAGLLCALLGYGDANDPSPSTVVFVTDTTTSSGGAWLCDPYPLNVPGWTPGEVMLTLLAEAVARGVPTVTRMIPTFTAAADTYGVAWDRSVDFSFDFGTEYSDVINKIEEIKADFFFEPITDGNVWMHAYTSRGIDKSVQNGNTQPVVFSPGHNVTAASEDNEFSLVKNTLLTASKDGWFVPTEAGSNLAYGRIEGYLNVPGTAAMASQVATATLVKLGLAQDAVTVGFEPFDDHVPWVNFGVGDLVKAPTTAAYGSGGVLVARRVMSLSFSEDQATARVLYAAEFGTVNKDRTERIERWLKSVGEGTLGGSVANATTNGSTTGSAPINYPTTGLPQRDPVVVNPVLIGEVISGANIMPGSIVASDKMVANSITANSALIADAAINSAMIESLSANKITAGTIMAEIALAGRIATSLTGQRAEMDFQGFHAYDEEGREVFRADSDGDVFLAGEVRTGFDTEARIVLTDAISEAPLGTTKQVPRVLFFSNAGYEYSPAFLAGYEAEIPASQINEVQTVTLVGFPSGAASFTLTFQGQTTSSISTTGAGSPVVLTAPTAATVQTALEALSNIDPGDIVVTGPNGGPFQIAFQGQYLYVNVTGITGSGTGGGSISASTTVTGANVPAYSSPFFRMFSAEQYSPDFASRLGTNHIDIQAPDQYSAQGISLRSETPADQTVRRRTFKLAEEWGLLVDIPVASNISITNSAPPLRIGTPGQQSLLFDATQIQSTDGNTFNSRLKLQDKGSGVTLGWQENILGTSVRHPLQIGPSDFANMRFDVFQIQTYNNGDADAATWGMKLNPHGGSVICASTDDYLTSLGHLSCAQTLNSVGNAQLSDGVQIYGLPARHETGNILAASEVYAGSQMRCGGGISIGSEGNVGENTVLTGNHLYKRNGVTNGTTLNLNVLGSVGVVQVGGNGAVTTMLSSALTYPNFPTAGTANASLTAGGVFQRIASSRRFKENIKDLEIDVEQAIKLRPRTFQRNDRTDAIRFTDDEGVEHYEHVWFPITEDSPWEAGFVAEEAEELGLTQFVEYHPDTGIVEGFFYMNWITAQQAILQRHHEEIATMKEQISTLWAQVNG